MKVVRQLISHFHSAGWLSDEDCARMWAALNPSRNLYDDYTVEPEPAAIADVAAVEPAAPTIRRPKSRRGGSTRSGLTEGALIRFLAKRIPEWEVRMGIPRTGMNRLHAATEESLRSEINRLARRKQLPSLIVATEFRDHQDAIRRCVRELSRRRRRRVRMPRRVVVAYEAILRSPGDVAGGRHAWLLKYEEIQWVVALELAQRKLRMVLRGMRAA